jgi:hypothetical protein
MSGIEFAFGHGVCKLPTSTVSAFKTSGNFGGTKQIPTGKNQFEQSSNSIFQLGNSGLFLELRLSDRKTTDVMI